MWFQIDAPGKPGACNDGLLRLNNGLLWGIVACCFGLLGLPGRRWAYGESPAAPSSPKPKESSRNSGLLALQAFLSIATKRFYPISHAGAHDQLKVPGTPSSLK